MSVAGVPHHNEQKKYSDADYERMEHMRYVERQPWDVIGKEFGIKAKTAKKILQQYGSRHRETQLSVPDVKNWDFRMMDVA